MHRVSIPCHVTDPREHWTHVQGIATLIAGVVIYLIRIFIYLLDAFLFDFFGKVVYLMLTGTARTEEESSLVGEADLHSNLLPDGEKVRTPLLLHATRGVGAQG